MTINEKLELIGFIVVCFATPIVIVAVVGDIYWYIRRNYFK